MSKRVNILESQYGILKKFEIEDDKGLSRDEKVKIDNQFLGMEIVDVKDAARQMITKAFRLGIKYGRNPKDLYLRKEIKQKIDGMIQSVDKYNKIS